MNDEELIALGMQLLNASLKLLGSDAVSRVLQAEIEAARATANAAADAKFGPAVPPVLADQPTKPRLEP